MPQPESQNKKRDRMILLIFFAFLFIAVAVISRINSHKSLKSIHHGDAAKKEKIESAKFGANLRGNANFSTITMEMLFDERFLSVNFAQLRGAEFRPDMTGIFPSSSREFAIQAGVNSFYMRSAICDGKLVAILTQRDGGDFEVLCDCFIRDVSDEDAQVWSGYARKGKKILTEPVFICKNCDFPTSKDIIFAYFADTKSKRIKDFKFGSVKLEK